MKRTGILFCAVVLMSGPSEALKIKNSLPTPLNFIVKVLSEGIPFGMDSLRTSSIEPGQIGNVGSSDRSKKELRAALRKGYIVTLQEIRAFDNGTPRAVCTNLPVALSTAAQFDAFDNLTIEFGPNGCVLLNDMGVMLKREPEALKPLPTEEIPSPSEEEALLPPMRETISPMTEALPPVQEIPDPSEEQMRQAGELIRDHYNEAGKELTSADLITLLTSRMTLGDTPEIAEKQAHRLLQMMMLED